MPSKCGLPWNVPAAGTPPQDWEGFQLRDILERAGMLPEAASVTVRSVTGYYRRFSLDEVDRCWLATRVGGESLSHRHGFPLRLVAPGKRGFEWVKWVEGIEVNHTSKWWQPPPAPDLTCFERGPNNKGRLQARPYNCS